MSRKRIAWKLTWSGPPDRHDRIPETWNAKFGHLSLEVSHNDHGGGVDSWSANAWCSSFCLHGAGYDQRDDAMRYAETLVHVFRQKVLEELQSVHQEIESVQNQRRVERERMYEEAAAKRRQARERRKAKSNANGVVSETTE